VYIIIVVCQFIDLLNIYIKFISRLQYIDIYVHSIPQFYLGHHLHPPLDTPTHTYTLSHQGLIPFQDTHKTNKFSDYTVPFLCHVQNATIPCRSQELPPFLSVMYIFLPPFSTNYSSILSYLILPSISWSTSQSCCSQIHRLLFWEFYFLPFSVHAQTIIIYLTLLSLL
jgi:hypothetical protein